MARTALSRTALSRTALSHAALSLVGALALTSLPAAAAELGAAVSTAAVSTAAVSTAAVSTAAVGGPSAAGNGEQAARSGSRRSSAKSSAKSSGKRRSSAAARRAPAGKAAPKTSPRAGAQAAPRAGTRALPGGASRSAQARARTSGSSASRPGSSQGSQHQGSQHQGSQHQGSQHQQANNGPRAANAHTRPAARPSSHAAPARRAPSRHVVHHRAGTPMRWSPAYHRYNLRGVSRNSPRYWAHGIFIYSPPPARRGVVVVDSGGKRIKGADPSRAVDRNNSFGVGMRGGSYMSGYTDGGGYGDLGLGLALRYRPVESVGLELSWMHHSDTWDDHAERAEDPLSASVELFAFPWTRVSPYALVGVTVTPREATDTYFNGLENVTYQANDALAGPHVGLGIEFAVGQTAALTFEGKYTGYIDRQQGDTTIPAALQANMGLNFYF